MHRRDGNWSRSFALEEPLSRTGRGVDGKGGGQQL